MRFLIINADDFGYSQPRDEGIVECYRKGGITSASLMVNGVSAESGVALAKRHHLPLGLHANVTEGKPIGQTEYKTIVDQDGFFLGMFEFRQKAIDGNVDIDEVRNEIECQVQKFKEVVGDLPTHVDGHQHAHILPGITETFAAILKSNNIKASRIPDEFEGDGFQWSTPKFAKMSAEVIQNAREARPIFSAAGIWSAETFLGLKTMGEEILGVGSEMTFDKLTKQFSRVFGLDSSTNSSPRKDGQGTITCELMTHPGYLTKEKGGCGNGPDDFSQSLDREREIGVLLDKRFPQFYQNSDIKLVSFKDCVEKFVK